MAKWKTVLSVYENGREMPAPKSEAVFTWQPSTPKMTIATAFEYDKKPQPPFDVLNITKGRRGGRCC